MKKDKYKYKSKLFKKFNGGGSYSAYNDLTSAKQNRINDTSSGLQAASTAASVIPVYGTIAAAALQGTDAINKISKGITQDEFGIYKTKKSEVADKIFNPVAQTEGLVDVAGDVFRGQSSFKDVSNTILNTASLGLLGTDRMQERAKKQKLEADKKLQEEKKANYLKSASDNTQNAINTGQFKGNQQYSFMKNGGTVKDLSSNSVEFYGSSHENGGIKEPTVKGTKLNNAEVEGGETAVKENNETFIFSKELGFADRHKTIARKIGKTERQLESNNNAQSRNTLLRLKGAEDNLKQEQEVMKTKLGIPSDLNKKQYGGLINKPIGKSDIRTFEGELKPKNLFKKFGIGGQALSFLPDVAGLASGIGANLANRDLIKQRQRMLDNLPDQQTSQMLTQEEVKQNYNPAIREARLQQTNLNNQFGNPQIAAANKANITGSLIDSINRNQSDLNNTNTDIRNKTLFANNQIQTKNNEIVRQNNLTRLGGQDDIIRDKSQANADLANVFGNTAKNMAERSLSKEQNRFDFGNLDHKLQKHIATNSKGSLSSLYSKKQIDKFAGIESTISDKKLKRLANRVRFNPIIDQTETIERYGGLIRKKYKTGGLFKNKV